MSEIKRVALSTFEPQKVSDKVNKKACKTVRISVILPESNEDKCPEYNYKDQLAAVKKRVKQIKEPNNVENGLDPFGEDDDDVKRIALEMEAKYGAGMKKKRKGRKDDYADIGMGYDESDSFIDNTDGYDEIIPQNVTTLHGGFYINCGALEFKTDDEASSDVSSNSSDSEDDDKIKSTNRKRVLETSEESESDTANTSQLEKKPKLHSNKNSMQQAIKKKLFSQNKIQVKKRRLIDPLKKTVKELLREKREDLNMSIPSELHPPGQLPEDQMEKDSLKENKKPMSIISVTDAIESVVKQTGEVEYDSNQIKQNNDVNKNNDLLVMKPDAPSSVEGESSQDGHKTDRVEVKLPENLPTDILGLINNIKQAALGYKGEGIKKFFTDEVNTMLLNLERKIKILGKSSRVKIYDHLSFFIKCRRETVTRRAKNLILEDEERKLKKLTDRLKDCISEIMPSLIINYEQECQIIQKKFSKESCENDENKALKMPRKGFRWTDETRKLLKDILSIKKRCLLLEGKQKDNLEEQVTQYLKKEILPFWPDGWVHLNTLKKVYNSMSDNSKLSDNNNSTASSKKPHSNITISPVLSSKTNGGSTKTDISNDINFKLNTKLKETFSTNSQPTSIQFENSIVPVKSIAQPSSSTTVEVEKTKSEGVPDVKESPIVSSIAHKESEKIIHEKDQDYQRAPNVHIGQPNIIREREKPKYESDLDYRKNIAKSNVIQIGCSAARENEKANHEKDNDYRKNSKPERDHETKKESSKHHRVNDLVKSTADSRVIVLNTHKEEFPATISEVSKESTDSVIPVAKHCPVIDLTDLSERKANMELDSKPFDLSKEALSFDLVKSSNSKEVYNDPRKSSSKYTDLPFFPNAFCSTPKVSKSDGDDIQMVMENLKALQKLSSPVKAENSTGSPVSVIAYNKSFSPKSNSSQSSAGQRSDYSGKNDFAGSFRDEFQQQFINSLQQLAASSSSSKTNYNRCS